MNSWVKTVNGKGGAAAVALLSVACLAVAVYLQESKGWFPCALCIVQRYAYMATAFFAVLGALLGGRARKACWALAGLAALAGAGTAGYHVWVLAHPGQDCGVDPLQLKLNALPWTAWAPTLLEADGLCTAEYPPLLGLHLPVWSGLGLALQALWAALALRTSR